MKLLFEFSTKVKYVYLYGIIKNNWMRVKGLDTLRFVLAMIVVVGHIGYDFTQLSNMSSIKLGLSILNNMFCGPAAVIVFFIISGFCIHFPYAQGKTLKPVEFEIKRFIRISIPAIFAMAFYYYLTFGMLGVVWSLICELIYYFFYPLLLNIIRRNNNSYKIHAILFTFLLILSVITSLSYEVFNDQYNGDFIRSGYQFTWLVGFPIWYLGVILADVYLKGVVFKFLHAKYINIYRLGIFGITIACSIARYHLNISFVYSLIVFSIPAFFWLYTELMYYRDKNENKILEFGGMMSYSIYLIHAVLFHVLIYVHNYFGKENIRLNDNFIYTVEIIFFTLIFSYIFYITIEKPSHKLAQMIKLK